MFGESEKFLMKKIVFLDQALNPGGAEKVMTTIIRSLDPEKFDIHLVIVSKLGELNHLVPQYVKIHELGIKHTRNALFSTRKLLKKLQPDVVYSTLSNTNILLILSSFGMSHKTIVRYPNTPSREKNAGKLKGWRYILMKFSYKRANMVIAQTEEMAFEINKFYNISKKRIKTITNPIDTKHIATSIEGEVSPFKNNKINVVASGALIPKKGFDILIRSFSKVLNSSGDFCLNIIGKDYYGTKEQLNKIISELKLEKNVIFWEFQENPYPFYKFCDLFVLSSRWEGLPNVILECQYFGKPVIATRCVPVIERLIDNGKNGFVVDVEDVDGLAEAILNFRQLKGEKIFRDSINEFENIFDEIGGKI